MYTPHYNIFELYNVLVQVRFTTSKTKLEIQYDKLDIRVVSRVNEQLNIEDLRKIANISKISKYAGARAECPVFAPEIKCWQQQSKKKTRKTRYQTFLAMSKFTAFPYLIPYILPGIVKDKKQVFYMQWNSIQKNVSTSNCMVSSAINDKFGEW